MSEYSLGPEVYKQWQALSMQRGGEIAIRPYGPLSEVASALNPVSRLSWAMRAISIAFKTAVAQGVLGESEAESEFDKLIEKGKDAAFPGTELEKLISGKMSELDRLLAGGQQYQPKQRETRRVQSRQRS